MECGGLRERDEKRRRSETIDCNGRGQGVRGFTSVYRRMSMCTYRVRAGSVDF